MRYRKWKDSKLDLLVETVDQLNDRYTGDWGDISAEELAFVLQRRPDFRSYMCGHTSDEFGNKEGYCLFSGTDQNKLRRAAKLAGYEVTIRGWDVVRIYKVRRNYAKRKPKHTEAPACERVGDHTAGVHPGGGV